MFRSIIFIMLFMLSTTSTAQTPIPRLRQHYPRKTSLSAATAHAYIPPKIFQKAHINHRSKSKIYPKYSSILIFPQQSAILYFHQIAMPAMESADSEGGWLV